jgi:hypothetical protein
MLFAPSMIASVGPARKELFEACVLGGIQGRQEPGLGLRRIYADTTPRML